MSGLCLSVCEWRLRHETTHIVFLSVWRFLFSFVCEQVQRDKTYSFSSIFYFLGGVEVSQRFVLRVFLFPLWHFGVCFKVDHSASGYLASSRCVLDLSCWFHFIAQKSTRQWAHHIVFTRSANNTQKKGILTAGEKKTCNFHVHHSWVIPNSKCVTTQWQEIAVGAFFCTNDTQTGSSSRTEEDESFHTAFLDPLRNRWFFLAYRLNLKWRLYGPLMKLIFFKGKNILKKKKKENMEKKKRKAFCWHWYTSAWVGHVFPKKLMYRKRQHVLCCYVVYN